MQQAATSDVSLHSQGYLSSSMKAMNFTGSYSPRSDQVARKTDGDILGSETLPELGQVDMERPDYERHFPAKLHYLLEVLEKDGQGNICSFQPHGRAFLVHDQKRFVEEILPKWFQQHRWASFQRQLNHYEFKRLSGGQDKGAYHHPCFLIGRRELCRFIHRIKVKGKGPRKPNCPETEPDFYASSRLDVDDKKPKPVIKEDAQGSHPSRSATASRSTIIDDRSKQKLHTPDHCTASAAPETAGSSPSLVGPSTSPESLLLGATSQTALWSVPVPHAERPNGHGRLLNMMLANSVHTSSGMTSPSAQAVQLWTLNASLGIHPQLSRPQHLLPLHLSRDAWAGLLSSLLHQSASAMVGSVSDSRRSEDVPQQRKHQSS